MAMNNQLGAFPVRIFEIILVILSTELVLILGQIDFYQNTKTFHQPWRLSPSARCKFSMNWIGSILYLFLNKFFICIFKKSSIAVHYISME